MSVSLESELSLYHLLDHNVLADPYPLYRRLRTEDPVHWDPYLHSWVVTRYADVVAVLPGFSAQCTPTPEALAALDLSELTPVAEVMTKQMLFLDPPQHTRVRQLAAAAFTPRRVEALRAHIQDITTQLLDAAITRGELEVMADLANPLPAIVTAGMLGLPTADHRRLKQWSEDFGEMLGNFQQNPGRARRVLESLQVMSTYFSDAVRAQLTRPTSGLVNAMSSAEVDGDRLTEDEVVANLILTMVGAQETTANLIGNGLLTLLRRPEELHRLRTNAALMPSAIEELLRFESPSQYTARIAVADLQLGDKLIRKGQGVIAVMGAANRDPERFPDPDRVDLARPDNRHLAFGWGSHFCFGAALARIEGQIALSTLLRRFPRLELRTGTLDWRHNLGLRGLTALPVSFSP